MKVHSPAQASAPYCHKSAPESKKIDEFAFNEVYILSMVNSSGQIIEKVEGQNVAHVMITQPLTLMSKAVFDKAGNKIGEHPALQVVESTGRGKGVVVSDYDILSVDKKGIFTIWRGSQNEEMKVQIFRVFGF